MTAIQEAILHGLHQSGLLDEVPPSKLRAAAQFVEDALDVQLPESEEGVAWARKVMTRGTERYGRERIAEIAGRVA